MANQEVIFNESGNIAYDNGNEQVWIKQKYEPDGTLIRYYPLTHDANDYGVYGGNLSNTGVTFDKGYAEFSDDNGILIDHTLTFGQLSAEFTMFCWHKYYTGTTYSNVCFIDDTNGYYSLYQDNTTSTSKTFYNPGTTENIEITTNIGYDTWNWTCVVQYFGSYRQFWAGDLNGLINSGITVSPDADALGDMEYISLGSIENNNRFRGGISGFFIRNGRWFESDILEQASKGPPLLNRDV